MRDAVTKCTNNIPTTCRYGWFLAFITMWHILVYCPLAHWIFFSATPPYGLGGWLSAYGAIDFAGGMVVHTSSGVSSFVLTYWLGKSKVVHKPHNIPYVLLGASLLWFGCVKMHAALHLAQRVANDHARNLQLSKLPLSTYIFCSLPNVSPLHQVVRFQCRFRE